MTLVFDGGSLGNPGKGYGSYLCRGMVATPQPVRLEYPGRTTNNQAEYLTLLHGLRAILGEVDSAAAHTSVAVLSDSKLLVEQVSGRWKIRNVELQPLAAEARQLLGRFGRWRLEWQPRTESVRLLGH